MSFNPPDTRDEIRDTLFFMGVPHRYDKRQGRYGHEYHLRSERADVVIRSPRNIIVNRERLTSAYAAKRSLMTIYSDRLL